MIGSDAYGFVAREYGRPVVVAGFEPLDILQSISMLLAAARTGEARSRTSTRARCGRTGTRSRSRRSTETMEVREEFEWRGLGSIPDSALPAAAALRRVRRRAPVRPARRARRGSEGVPLRRRPPRHARPCDCKRLRHGLHAGAAARDVHGLGRGRLRRLLGVRAATVRGTGRRRPVAGSRDGCHARSRRGRQGDRDLVEGSSSSSSRNAALAPLGDSRRRRGRGRGIAFSTDAYVVQARSSSPGGDIGSLAVNGTVNDLAVVGARPLG